MLEFMCYNFFDNLGYTISSLHCNPAGDWNIGGLDADAGLTGRKLAVDNYGPRVPIGGGAFSGKDSSTKVDRGAAYMARKIAVDYLKKYNAKEVIIQLSYAIGYSQPIQATAIVDGNEIVITEYDLTPKGISDYLDLKKPIYAETAKWGHMGNRFNWG
jgi:S-adenosylmethionine synthetase